MPTTYTTNTGISKPGPGELEGAWAPVANVSYDIIDRAINGVGTISLSGTTHTLTTSDGLLSDGQYKVLVFAGSPSGTNTVTIAPNDAQKLYVVRNASGQSVILSQGSGSNVTVPDGRVAVVYANGAGAGAAVVDLTALFGFQPLATTLTALAGLSVADGNFIVGNGTTWVVESGNTALTSLGVTATAAELNKLDGVTATTAEINILDGVTATTAEINILDGVTATTAELNFVDGVTSNVQTQLNAKQATITGGATSITSANLTASRALVSDGSGKVGVSAVTSTELGYLDGVTSALQTQLNGKQATITGAATTITGSNLTASRALISNGSGKVAVSDVTSAELGYLDGVTSAIQTQLNALSAALVDQVFVVRETTVSAAARDTTANDSGGSGWAVLKLNATGTNTISGASLNAGTWTVTLPAGRYRISSHSFGGDSNWFATRLWSVTDGAGLVFGGVIRNGGTEYSNTIIEDVFDISGTTEIQLHQTNSGRGGGVPSITVGNIWSRIVFHKFNE